MKGDFSKGDFSKNRNYAGVLHQQGRVLLDSDWNAQTHITNYWQDTAARDTIGPGVVAVPADTPDAFEVKPKVNDGQVTVQLSPGRVWIDGLLLHHEEEQKEFLVLDSNLTNNSEGRYAVVLEAWREAVNGFQEWEALIEPALGGPDTTERVHTAMALRLLRLQPGQNCENIRRLLTDDLTKRGSLTVTFDQNTSSEQDCPVSESGGYTGFEHYLYRIEIALTNRSEPMFKWSQFNGGLVGRGDCNTENGENFIMITANDQAITKAGLDSFYLEIIDKDDAGGGLGHWRVVYGAKVNLLGDRLVVRGGEVYYNENGAFSGDVFFRLWNDIEEVSQYSVALTGPKHFHDGIHLEFWLQDTIYIPGDYWTFPVRAGWTNPKVLLRRQPPEGIHYHRAPLAVLHWEDGKIESIEDCRHAFRPLTKQKVCCSYTVGDGTSTHGDFDSIQEALDKLPVHCGGELCLLPGVHRATVRIEDRFNVKIKGCGLRAIVFPAKGKNNIFNIVNSSHISLENMTMIAEGAAVMVEGPGPKVLQGVEVAQNYILAITHAVRISEGANIRIHDNIIRMVDRKGGDVALYIHAEGGLVERNDISVVTSEAADDETEEWLIGIWNYCIDFGTFYGSHAFISWLPVVFGPINAEEPMSKSVETPGGIQVASGCERIKIVENHIHGGSGNGITLGSSLDVEKLVGGAESIGRNNELDLSKGAADVIGSVQIDGHPPGEAITIFFKKKNSNESPKSTTTDKDGSFEIRTLTEGTYSIGTEEGYSILEVEQQPGSEIILGREMLQVCTIQAVRVEPPDHLFDILAFTIDISIIDNEITGMGLSGIGVPKIDLNVIRENKKALNDFHFVTLLAEHCALVTGLVVDLLIQDNQIMNCLQKEVDREVLRRRGEGGISLGLCEKVTIQQNQIEANGPDYTLPACGIFVSYAAQANINHNRIINNGPIMLGRGKEFLPGIRGGIVLRLTKPLMLAGIMEVGAAVFNFPAIAKAADRGSYAVRIHDNVVKQPVGQALSIIGFGPTSVLSNCFYVDSSNIVNPQAPDLGVIDLLAGAILIMGVGSKKSNAKLKMMSTANPEKNGNDTHLFQGPTVFGNNQTYLGVNLQSLCSQLILTWEDLGFCNNNSTITKVQGNLPFLVNTALLASTLRAGYGRFEEPDPAANSQSLITSDSYKSVQYFVFSLLTISDVMNNTSNNIGDHHIYAINFGGHPLLGNGNSTL